jgi:chromosome segregation protein
VTRKLRVTKGGTYTSTYAINDEPCTLSYLHEQLNRRRIYAEGYNVVLQGDVTSIISMNARQRREIIDELAGVANFDRKIGRAKEKLEAVKEKEERFRIVEQELVAQRDRLARDRVKAEKYKQLRAEMQLKASWESILHWRDLQQQIQKLQQILISERATQTQLETQIVATTAELQQITATLEAQNAKVKALGEEEQLALQSAMAGQEVELRQLQRQQGELEQARQATATTIAQIQQQLQEQQQALEQVSQQRQQLQTQTVALTQQRDQAQQALEEKRDQSQTVAQSADAWVQQQALIHQHIDTLLQTLEPQRAEQAQLQERLQLLGRQSQIQQQSLTAL